jgi:hypothetical protein
MGAAPCGYEAIICFTQNHYSGSSSFTIVWETSSFYKISVAATHHHFPMLLLLGPIVLRRCCYNELIGKTLCGRQLMHGDLLLLMQLH